MKIGIYTKSKSPKVQETVDLLIHKLAENNIQIWLNEHTLEIFEKQKIPIHNPIEKNKKNKIPKDLDCLITIGGDGTFISGITHPKLNNIPTLGINTGRLGFLADILPEEIPEALSSILNKNYEIEKRSLLSVKTLPEQDINFSYALNEIAILKHHTSNMIRIHAYINETFLTSYWADGLIIATPTGSTAYSMSAGGPILHPESKNLVITPIAPHNLSNRPLVIPDHNRISLKIESRDDNFLVSLDANSYAIDSHFEILIQKSTKYASLIKIKKNNFYQTIRNKLMWGIDKRN